MHIHRHTHTKEDHVIQAKRQSRLILIAMVGLSVFVFVEFVAGFMSHSLALLADAAHMLGDIAALTLSLVGFQLSAKGASAKFSYGRYRAEILSAFINGSAMLGMALWIFIEAFVRFFEGRTVEPVPIIIVASLGVIVNFLAFRLLHGESHLNTRSAALHMLWDFVGSVGTLVAGIIILFTGRMWVDPLISVFLSLFLLRSSLLLTMEAVHILMEGKPSGVSAEGIRHELIDNFADIKDVHHIHVWSLTSNHHLITMHVRCEERQNDMDLLRRIKAYLKAAHGLGHATIQMEYGSCVDDEGG